MVYNITNQNLVVVQGGHATIGSTTLNNGCRGNARVKSIQLGPGKPDLGSQRHYPIFKSEDGTEYISLDGLKLRKISELNLQNTRRETVERK